MWIPHFSGDAYLCRLKKTDIIMITTSRFFKEKQYMWYKVRAVSYTHLLAGKQHIPVEVIRRADEVGSPDIRGLLSCGKDIRGWYAPYFAEDLLARPTGKSFQKNGRTPLGIGRF